MHAYNSGMYMCVMHANNKVNTEIDGANYSKVSSSMYASAWFSSIVLLPSVLGDKCKNSYTFYHHTTGSQAIDCIRQLLVISMHDSYNSVQ